MLPNGHYKTEHGSEMWISGKHGGISRVEFDWLDEDASPSKVADQCEKALAHFTGDKT